MGGKTAKRQSVGRELMENGSSNRHSVLTSPEAQH
jgi:hypothetical protein